MVIVRQGKGGKAGSGGSGGSGGKGGKGDKDPVPGGRPTAGALALLALLCAAPLTAAQGYDVLVSLSADDALPTGAVRDEDLVLQGPAAPAHVAWPSETLSLLAGDAGTGSWVTFTDVDAVSDVGGAVADQGLYVSLGTDEAGFKDGDVMRAGGGSYTVAYAEAFFISITGATDGNVDVDAFQLDPDGSVIFSFGDSEASSFLSSDGSGIIQDGDVLRWPFGAADAHILIDEATVSALVTHALGSSATIATTDTLSLARDPLNGSLLFTVQSPTANDGTVFSEIGGGTVVPGHAEADFGFTGSPEIDALSVAVAHFPATTVSSGNPPAGGSVSVMVAGCEPGVPHLVLAAFVAAPSVAKPKVSGWGSFVLAHDTLLGVSWGQALTMSIVPDTVGLGSFVASLPAGLPATDVVIQLLAPATSTAPKLAGNPVLLQLAQ